MKKIYDFSRFSSLYEADTAAQELKVAETEASKLYDQTLSLILTTALNSYASELSFPIKSYDANIDADIVSIKSSPIADKSEAMVKVMQKVQKAAEDNKLEGAKEAVDAWVAAGSKAADALSAMVDQYKDQPDELKHINNFVNAKLDSFLKEIEESSKENDLKMQIATKANESESYGEEIFEGIFQGKKGMIEDVSRQITLVNAKLASLAQTPGMAADVQRLQNEVTQISAKMGELLGKSNKEINKEEIKKAAARLAEIPTEADKVAEKMLKQDATNKEASSILIQALSLAQDAKNKEVSYLQKKEQALQKEKDSKITVKISTDRVDYDPDNTKVVNPEVKKFQELVVNKFGKIKQIADLPQFKMMGTDGKFGKGTRDIVVILKKGFGLPDSSKDITKELMDEIQTQVIKESKSNVLSFEGYVNLYEEFNVSVAVDTAKTLPTYTQSTKKSAAKPASSSGSSSKSATTPASTTTTSGGRLLSVGSQESWDAVSKALSDKKVGTKAKWEKSTYSGRELWRGYYPANSADFIPETITILFKDGKGGDYLKSDPSKSLANYSWTWDSGKNNWEFLGTTYTDLGNKNKIGSLSSDEAIAIAKKIKDAAEGGFGTNLNKFVSAVDAINSLSLLKAVEYQLSKSRSFLSSIDDSKLTDYDKKKIEGYKNNIQFYVNDEMGSDDYSAVKLIADALNKISGVKATYTKDGDEFKEDSFKLTF